MTTPGSNPDAAVDVGVDVAVDVGAAHPVVCPICEYDLRGLVEPRCPECGFKFEWRELLDPALRAHPYLFEHHPRHNLWSFWRTLLGGFRPHGFCRALRPSQPSRPGRLVLYWVLAATLGFANERRYAVERRFLEHRDAQPGPFRCRSCRRTPAWVTRSRASWRSRSSVGFPVAGSYTRPT